MVINIDKTSGFCFGVLNAISMAEQYLKKYGTLFCLGDIVHNNKELERLREMGLIIIGHDDLENLYNTRILIRAHGEPPQTYAKALENNNEIIDASCPVVLKLQKRIRKSHEELKSENGQLVVFGKKGHAEVTGLQGQTNFEAIVVGTDFEELDQLDYSRPIALYSQTTQDRERFQELKEKIAQRIKTCSCTTADKTSFKAYNTICGQVADRAPKLAEFARNHDVVIFVGGEKSSNAKYLFNVCRQNNPSSWFVSGREHLQEQWFAGCRSVGICGATSTPMWLMQQVAEEIRSFGG